ncbi:MAG: lamin tail domain-containing protein [Saprospiraceae bacterium]
MFLFKKGLLIALLSIYTSLNAQIVINELSSTNNKIISDEDGDSPDWIELYNKNQQTINIESWSLSDKNYPGQWILPKIDFPGLSHLIVFASGKNRKYESSNNKINHWETAVSESDEWRYFVGVQEPPANWNQNNFDNSTWAMGPGGFGFGDADDNTIIPDKTISVYYQKYFEITSPSEIQRGILSMDYDDAFVAYLNGVEIARNNINGSPVSFNALSNADHEATLYSGGIPEFFEIDTLLLSSILKKGSNLLSIQINNVSESSSDLSGRTWLHFGISSSTRFFSNNPSWFKLIADTSNSKPLHTNFKIAANEIIYLFDNNKILQDSIQADAQFNMSNARIPDGAQWCFAEIPTPGSKNSGNCFVNYSSLPLVSPPPGFYAKSVNINISGSSCYYTTDGSDPTINSSLYTATLSRNKNTILKVRSIESGKLPGEIFTGVYLIDQNTKLPIVSISSAPRNLFNDGTNGPAVYDKARGFTQSEKTFCHVQYFDKNRSLVFQDNASFTPVGNYSLDFGQKSIQFVFDEDYGAKTEQIPNIFNLDKPKIKTIHGFRVRNMDDDASSTRMRDLIANRMGILTESGSAAYQNVAVYINGVYWGHYAAREMLDKNFMNDNYNANPDSVNIVKTSYSIKPDYYPEEGSTESFFNLTNLIINSDLSDSLNYLKVLDQIDVENWVDYFANEIYNNNQDWYPSVYFNNIRLGNATDPDINWKFVLWDMGISQGNGTGVNEDLLTTCLEYPTTPNLYTNMMKSLLRNNKFKNYFINRFADLLNETWMTNRIQKMIDDNAKEIESEIRPHNVRWGSVDSSSWRNNISGLKQFHSLRPAYQRSHILNYFKLKKQVDITLDALPKGSGVIKISTIIPDKLPWTGIYFNGNPVKITAISNPGYYFSHWSSNEILLDTTSQTLRVDVSKNSNFIAHFSGSKVFAEIEVSEINYNSDSTISSGDWIELHNLSNSDLNLSDYNLSNVEYKKQYKLPLNTVIEARGYLVLYSDLKKFELRNPSVKNIIGPIGFELNNHSDSFLLFNRSLDTILAYHYSDEMNWPCTADGHGRTLELKSEKLDPNLPESWFDGCIGGSPGKAYSSCKNLVLISEINYKSKASKDAGDWIELYNNQLITLNLSEWQIEDNKSNTYVIPQNTYLQTDEYLVCVQDSGKFKVQFPNINNFIGPMNFGLDGNGDIIRVYNSNKELIFSLCYNDAPPFPKGADGNGYTLELKDYNANVNDGNNWFDGCLGGSPGKKYDPNCNTVKTDNFSKDIFELKPNPASNYLYITQNEQFKIKELNVLNILGQKQNNITGQVISESKYYIDLSKIESGTYIIQFITEDNIFFTKKFVVQSN